MSYININFVLTSQVESQVEQAAIEALNEHILNNATETKKIITDCVKGAVRASINEILQSQDYRQFMREKIEEVMGVGK